MPFLTPRAAGEVEVIKTFLLQQLAQMRSTVVLLNDDQAQSVPTSSGLNLVALLEHTGSVASFWTGCAAQQSNEPDLPDFVENQIPLEELVERNDSLEEALRKFDLNVECATSNFDKIDDFGFEIPVLESPWIPTDLKSWEVRWVLVHSCTEIARHVGQADIIRETIDGKTAFELNDIADSQSK